MEEDHGLESEGVAKDSTVSNDATSVASEVASEAKDPVFYLESLLNLYVRTLDKNGIVILETVKSGGELNLIKGLDHIRRKDFLSEYLVMHIYTQVELPPRALRLMNHLGEYYSKTPVIEEHYLPKGFSELDEPANTYDDQDQETPESDFVISAKIPAQSKDVNLSALELTNTVSIQDDSTESSMDSSMESSMESSMDSSVRSSSLFPEKGLEHLAPVGMSLFFSLALLMVGARIIGHWRPN